MSLFYFWQLPAIVTRDFVTALFHQPLGSTGGTTDANGLNAFEPLTVNLLRSLDEMRVGIDTQALVVEHLAVGTLTPADKEESVCPTSPNTSA